MQVRVLPRVRAINSAEECLVYTQMAGGSNPSSPTDAPLVQWIGHLTTDQEIGVRVPWGVLSCRSPTGRGAGFRSRRLRVRISPAVPR